jgi:hypothetical protein
LETAGLSGRNLPNLLKSGETRMKRIIFLISVLILAASFFGATAQQSAMEPPKPALPVLAQENPQAEKFFGTIEKIDEIGKMIALKGKVNKEEKTLTFTINDKTKITRGKTEQKLADLKPGVMALVEYRKEGCSMTATAIKVSKPKAPPKKGI